MQRYKTELAWFSRLARHLARKWSGSILTTPELGSCELEISVRIESRIEQVATIRIRIEPNQRVVVYMFNANCHVGVVYVL